MKAYLINMHLLVPRSRSSAKVKVKYKGYISQKMAVLGAFMFYKHILFKLYIIHYSFIAVHCFNNGYVGKQLVAWKEYCAEYWLKELQESMDWCTGCYNITGILLKTVLNTMQSMNKLF